MSLHRVGPICGLLFLPLYAATHFVPELPEASDSDEYVLALYTDPGKAGLILLGSLLLAVAGVVLLVFLADLWRRLRPAGALATLTVSAGALYVGALFVAGTLKGGYAGRGGGPLEDAPGFEDSATLARVLTDMGIGMQLIYGLFARRRDGRGRVRGRTADRGTAARSRRRRLRHRPDTVRRLPVDPAVLRPAVGVRGERGRSAARSAGPLREGTRGCRVVIRTPS